MEVQIDTEFKGLCLKLTKERYGSLEEDLKANGCQEPVKLYQSIIVDGHKRHEICSRNQIDYDIEEVSFSSREEAMAWILKNQLKHSNITDLQRYYLIGKLYNSVKTAPGMQSNKKKTNPDVRSKTAVKIATEMKTSPGSVTRAGIYTKSLDAITVEDEGLKRDILTGKIKLSKEVISGFDKISPADQKEIIRSLKAGDFESAWKTLRQKTTGIKRKVTKPEVSNIKDENFSAPEDRYFVCLKLEPCILREAEIVKIKNNEDKNTRYIYHDNGKWYYSGGIPTTFKDIVTGIMNSYNKKNPLTTYMFTANINKLIGLTSSGTDEHSGDFDFMKIPKSLSK